MNLFALPSNEKDAVAFLQEKGILPAEMLCKRNHNMKLYFGHTCISWNCRKSVCRKKVNIRHGNWFTNTRLSFVTAVRFFYFWAHELTSIKRCCKELGMNQNTTVNWNDYMRDICLKYLKLQPEQKIGGKGLIVEVDESLFSKRKNNVGRQLPEQWIFGGICRETRKCFLTVVDDRKQKTLLAKIMQNIETGSVIYSDQWKGYQTEELEKAGYQHFTVDHSRNFVDPDTGVHTQNIERLWESAKCRNKEQRGTSRKKLESYLKEFIWRREEAMLATSQKADLFESLLNAIKTVQPPKLAL